MKNRKQKTRLHLLLILFFGAVSGVWLSTYLHGKLDFDNSRPHRDSADLPSKGRRTTSVNVDGENIETRRIAALTKTMQRARDIGLSLNSPMEFYGRVIDQYGKPVPGVKVKLRYVYYSAVVLATYEPHKAEEFHLTDKNGEISFSGKEGVSLTVTLEPQKGLRFGNNGYWSHSFQSDKHSGITAQPTARDNPYIFSAYRLGQPAELSNGFVEAYLLADKRIYQISLKSGKLVQNGEGDLAVSVWQEGAYGKRGTSWGINIQGGENLRLQATDDPLLYWAPIEGYQSSWDFSWADGNRDYSRARDFKFWVKQGDFYGAMSVECGAFFKGEFRLIIRSSLNKTPNDPNLQPVLPDWPAKDLPAGK